MTQPLTHPDQGNGLTNHEPMAVSALRELNAGDTHIAAFQQQYQPKVHPVSEPATTLHNDRDLQFWIGQHQNYPGLHAFFSQQLTRLGAQGVINRYLPLLADGVAGAALHPLIRLGHAVFDRNHNEIVAALAYWAWTYQALPWPANKTPLTKPPLEVIANLRQGQSWPSEAELDRPTITAEFNLVVSLPLYQLLAFQLSPDVLTLASLQELAITLFWMHDNFILLHAVTATQALGRIAPLLDEPKPLFAPLWKAIVIGWLVKDLHWQTPTRAPEPSLALHRIQHLATQAANVHTIKLVAACLAAYRETGDSRYWLAAERRVCNDAQTRAILDQQP